MIDAVTRGVLPRLATFALAAGVVAGGALSARALTGEEKVFGDGVVVYTNASEVSWIDYTVDGDPRRDLLLAFTNSAEAASFVLPGTTKAWILAIGGGGGGGGLFRNGGTSTYAGGGGGGAGGFIELTNELISAGVYAVAVGKGGDAAKNVSAGSGTAVGENGGNSTIYRRIHHCLRRRRRRRSVRGRVRR